MEIPKRLRFTQVEVLNILSFLQCYVYGGDVGSKALLQSGCKTEHEYRVKLFRDCIHRYGIRPQDLIEIISRAEDINSSGMKALKKECIAALEELKSGGR